jgi:methyltransferase (TIGR00027 family)
MVESSPSRTALITSLMRALHARTDASPLLLDPWGDRLVPGPEREAMSARILGRMDAEAQERALRSPGAVMDDFLLSNVGYSGVVIRSRYAEDALQAATARGVRQYVLIGAGFDSFALRRPAFADALQIFEIDHPATQTLKLQRIRECGIPLPSSVHFIAADLAREDLATALDRSSFRNDEPAFFSWLGVTVYLTRQANLATLRAVAACSAPGSEIVFTYIDQVEFAPGGSRSAHNSNAQAVAMAGEPYVSGFEPDQLAGDLAAVGLTLVEDLDGKAMAARYAGMTANPLQPLATQHLALARVPVRQAARDGG